MVGPVGVEVAVAGQGAEFEDGFGAVEAPAGAGDVHAVGDEVAAGAFDDAGGDGPAGGERGRVVEVWGLVGEVGGADLGVGSLGDGDAAALGAGADVGGDAGGVAVEDVMGSFVHPP